ncbi:protein RRP5 homolog [Anopheles merus]|uniref:rRNA biogenesis protein RRP5 n=1 Tax=Anopheles merus TaxID=30066 RepID=A0A182V1Q8_ANOME|nr:protein RRP5 homolog [Anopheles merus]
MVYVEPALPRGPSRPVVKHNRVKKHKTPKSHFGAKSLPAEQKAQRLRPKERWQAMQSEKEMEEEQLQQCFKASNLVFGKVRAGMLLLGCVKQIRATELLISLPGRLNGIVQITNISEAYSKRLEYMYNTRSTDCPTLGDLYTVGDLVYMKVLRKVKDRRQIYLTLDPTKLHSDFKPAQLVEGLVLAATITVKEDHGYTMDIGVRNVRAFLPQEHLNGNPDDEGRNLFCSIHSVTPSGSGAVVVLKAFRPNEPRVLNVEELAVETIVPGCQLTFTVGEPVEYGLRGMLFEDSITAYVNRNMLTKVTSNPEKYSMFKTLPATLLYVMPVTNEVFVSLRPYPNNRADCYQVHKVGSIIENARVKCTDGGGVWLEFDNKCRALLPIGIIRKTAEAAAKGNVDESVMLSNFQVGTTHRVGVVYFDPLENTYIVSNSPDHAETMIQDSFDVEIGKTYKCRVLQLLSTGALVGVGRATGIVKYEFFNRDSNLKVRDVVPMRAVCRALENDFLMFTNQPMLLNEKASILMHWSQLDRNRKDQKFVGAVSQIRKSYVWVRFFNNLSGRIDTSLTVAGQDEAEVAKLRQGSIRLFTVLDFNEDANIIDLALKQTDQPVRTAQLARVTVSYVHATGAEVLTENGEQGTIPAECFSEFGEHNSLYMRLLRGGETLTAVKTNPETYSARLTQYYQENPIALQSVRAGMVLKGSCVTVNGKPYVTPLLSDFHGRFPVHIPPKCHKIEDGSIIKLRVAHLNPTPTKGPAMKVETEMAEVCEDIFTEIGSFMGEYLQDVNRLIERFRELDHTFAHYSIGDPVECVIESTVAECNKMAVEVQAVGKRAKYPTKGIVTTVLPKRPASSYKVGQQVPGRVVWIDVERKLVHVCVDEPLFPRIVLQQEDEEEPDMDVQRQCWVLFSNHYVNVCCVQSDPPCPLVIVPVKHHYNDFVGNILSTNTVEAQFVKSLGSMILALETTSYSAYNTNDKTIGGKVGKLAKGKKPQKQFDMKQKMIHAMSKQKQFKHIIASEAKQKTLKKKESTVDAPKIKQKKAASNQMPTKKGKKRQQEQQKDQQQQQQQQQQQKKQKKSKLKKKTTDKGFTIDQLDGCSDIYFHQLDGTEDTQTTGKKAVKRRNQESTTAHGKGLPGATNFWDTTLVFKRAQSDSSDDDDSDAEDQAETVPKKRATASERFEAMKQEEARLRKIEEELADPSLDPHTPDQFDRLVLAQPNNSMLWIRYMAFHMESAELDKARAVGRKALKAIHFRENAERLNVWIALLNLELRYETIDSFKEVLQEAIQYNDAFKVYTRALDILIDCQKHEEVQKILEQLLKKFRKQNDMWYLVADAWYRIGQGSKVKPLLSQALKSLSTRDHIPLILKFAFLHNRNENRDEAHLLFEQILTSYPKRTDIWSQYVDMLVKDNLVENARQILERAIMQRLPMKNMKTLYTKFVNFEEKHGDRESVRRVKHLAAEYVQAQLNSAGVK